MAVAIPIQQELLLMPKAWPLLLRNPNLRLNHFETWVSPESGGRYPIAWRITIPRLNMRLDVSAALKNQELLLKPITYWEGAIRAQGTVGEKNIIGTGYLELTGYEGRCRFKQP